MARAQLGIEPLDAKRLFNLTTLSFDSQVTCLTRCPRPDTERAANARLFLRSAVLVG
jgi:hypothetical protein